MSTPPAAHDAATPDTARSAVVAAAFGVALSASALLLPLLALEEGFSASTIGALTAISAAAQFAARIPLPWLLATVRDRELIVVAGVLLASSTGALLIAPTLAAFVVAQCLQGGARALFWTASQTHVARARGSATRRIAQLQMSSNAGSLAGPVLAGVIAAATSTRDALVLVVVVALVSAAVAIDLAPRPPYVRPARGDRGHMWREPALATAYWSSFVSGGWRGLLDSYVPVVLALGGITTVGIGVLTATAEGAALVAVSALAQFARGAGGHLALPATLAIAVGVALLPSAGNSLWLAAALLICAGAGGGVVMSLGPSIAHTRAAPGLGGTAVAVAGMYRAAARFATPAGTAAAAAAVGLTAALPLVAAVLAAPALVPVARRRGRR